MYTNQGREIFACLPIVSSCPDKAPASGIGKPISERLIQMSTRSFIRCVFQLRDVEDSLSMKWAFLPHRRYGHPNRYCKGSRESCQAHCDICPFRTMWMAADTLATNRMSHKCTVLPVKSISETVYGATRSYSTTKYGIWRTHSLVLSTNSISAQSMGA